LFRTFVLSAVIFSTAAFADADPKFTALRDQAENIASLGNFLEKYVGNCDSVLQGGGDCIKSAEAYRKGATGKKFYMIVLEQDADMLSMGPYNPNGNEFTINMTPFFPAANSALTHGAPTKTDANGNPVMPFLQIKGPIPELGNVSEISRAISSRQLRLQIVFTPLGLWELPKKGGGKIKGVKGRLDAVYVTLGRTGMKLALWINK
jgi:Family of unknown function (DUF6066)